MASFRKLLALVNPFFWSEIIRPTIVFVEGFGALEVISAEEILRNFLESLTQITILAG